MGRARPRSNFGQSCGNEREAGSGPFLCKRHILIDFSSKLNKVMVFYGGGIGKPEADKQNASTPAVSGMMKFFKTKRK
jgi:hypothetical protein